MFSHPGRKIQAACGRPRAYPSRVQALVQSYYEIDNLPEFLTQCGQFNRLSQLWQSCRSNIVNGENLAGMEVFLFARPGNLQQCLSRKCGREIIPQLDTWYDYNTQGAHGGNSTRVASVILPGLVQPNGQVKVKALVKAGLILDARFYLSIIQKHCLDIHSQLVKDFCVNLLFQGGIYGQRRIQLSRWRCAGSPAECHVPGGAGERPRGAGRIFPARCANFISAFSPGDKVKGEELSPYDLSRRRITYRMK